MVPKTKVSLAKSPNSYDGVLAALNLLEKDILKKLKGKKKILIKPNMVSVKHSLAATSPEALKAVLDFLVEHTKAKIIIAEGSATEDTHKGFKKLGYLEHLKNHRVKFIDLNKDKVGKTIEITDVQGKPLKIGVAKTVLDADFIISVTKPKTHDTGVVTLSLKNLLVGSVFEKWKIHQGKRFHWNLLEIAKVIKPALSIIDGTVSMEGEGPAYGEAKHTCFAVAGLDPLAVDCFVTNLMGFELSHVGYLTLCKENKLGEGDLSKIEVVGEDPKKFKFKFKPHPTFKKQVCWQNLEVKKPHPAVKLIFPLMSQAKKLIPGKVLLMMQEIKPLRQIVVKINNGF